MTRLFRARVSALMVLAVMMLAVWTAGCGAKTPPNLTPAATHAFYARQAGQVLDQIENFAIEGEAQTPKVISTVTARLIVKWHRETVIALNASADGWRTVVAAALDALKQLVPAAEYEKLVPFVALGHTLLDQTQ